MQKEIMMLAELKKKEKSLSIPSLPPYGKRGNKQLTFPDLLPVLTWLLHLPFTTLCWGGCCAQTFQSRKWRVGLTQVWFPLSFSLPFPKPPNTSTHINDNSTCTVHRISVPTIFCCFNYLLCFPVSDSPLHQIKYIVMYHLQLLEHKTLAYISQNYIFTVNVPAF